MSWFSSRPPAGSRCDGSGSGVLPGEQGDDKSANDHLRVLFKEEYCFDESVFYVNGIDWARRGDQMIEGEQALARGENVFGYVPGVNVMTAEADTPLLVSPLKTEGGRIVIDTQAFGSQLVILSADGACRAITVSSTGQLDPESGYSFDNGVVSFVSGRTGELIELQVAMPER